MIKDLTNMVHDIRSVENKGINIWGKALNIPQALGGLILINTPEGAIVLITVFVTLIIASQIHKRSPYSRIIGICHIPWLVLVPWLIYRLQTVEFHAIVQGWLTYVILTMIISLVFDIYDIVHYIKGSKKFTWAPK